MASLAVLGWRQDRRRQAVHQDPDTFGVFFVWRLKRQSPGASRPPGFLFSLAPFNTGNVARILAQIIEQGQGETMSGAIQALETVPSCSQSHRFNGHPVSMA